MNLYDAHNHFQDERLVPFHGSIWPAIRSENVKGMVVNGSCEEDWPAVMALARQHPEVIPSFGYHPWYIKERSANWQKVLVQFLDHAPSAIGEIGLDCWIPDHDLQQQEQVFVFQLRLAAERDLPVSIHCLQAWGRLLEILETHPRPGCGFVLHSFGGPAEMVEPLARLGAFFSLPGYYAHERKARQRETFRHVPPDRLLIETDAPDQSLPADLAKYSLPGGADGKPLNHPANLSVVYHFAADLLGQLVEHLAQRVEQNFLAVFGKLLGR